MLKYNNDFRLDIDEFRLREKLWDIRAVYATAVFLACSFDFPEVIEDQLAKGMFLADYINRIGYRVLYVAVKHGSCGVILVLITNKLTEITEEVIKVVIENKYSGKKVMRLFLNRLNNDVKITEDIVKTVVGN